MNDKERAAGSRQPDYRQIESDISTEAEFPVKVRDEYRVYFEEDAYRKMKAHAATTDEVEIGGVLIGNVFRDGQDVFLKVSAVIEGEGANNYGTQVTFTHETWRHINDVKDREYADMRIVGWYHTHPGFGVFLSKMDSFIQDNFFNQPYQVAVVIETRQHVEGCFIWVNGTNQNLRRYWVGQREVPLVGGSVEPFLDEAPAAEPSARPSVATAPQPEERDRIASMPILWMLTLLIAGFLLGRMMGAGDLRRAVNETLESELYSVLEFAALNASASEDFKVLGERIDKVQNGLSKENGHEAVEELAVISDLIGSYEKEYGRRRSSFRRDLSKLMAEKRSLSERVRDVKQEQDEIRAYIADLYLFRIQSIVGKPGPIDPGQLGTNEQRSLKVLVDRAIMDTPRNKMVLLELFPGLVEHYYPPANPEKKSTSQE